MNYNISYDVAAAILLVIVYWFHRAQYEDASKINRIFSGMLLATLTADIFDLFSAYTISYYERVHIAVNYIVNICYFVCVPIASLMLIWYINSYFDEDNNHIIIYSINRTLFIVYCVLVFTSPFSKLVFYFDENGIYYHGIAYGLIFGLPLYYILSAGVILVTKRQKMSHKAFMSTTFFMLIVAFTAVIQLLFFKNVLLDYFGAAIASIILYLNMETPDYFKLIETMKELDEAKQEADDANRAKSLFLANMSHEIRTPINGILGIDEIAIEENKDPIIEKYLFDIQDAGRNLLSIINDILDFSKVESGKMEVVADDYKPEDILYSVNNIISVKAREKNLSLIIKNEPSIPKVLFGDEARIQQIIINILNNGIKYTKAGHVALLMRCEPFDEERINLVIVVKDTGIGIKEEDQKHMFESFSRFDMMKNKKVEGTGLGLALTKQLVDLMEGSISVRSTYGVGTEFTVRIPQKVVDATSMGIFDEKSHSRVEKETISINLKGRKILAVDDVAMNLKVFEGFLKNTGAIISSATSGKDCIVLCENEKYDLIFLDHMMPEMDGMETLGRIKKDPESKNTDTPVIVLTANAISGIRDQYIEAGFTDYLSKPFDKSTLFNMITSYLGEGKSSAESQAPKVEPLVEPLGGTSEEKVVVAEEKEEKIEPPKTQPEPVEEEVKKEESNKDFLRNESIRQGYELNMISVGNDEKKAEEEESAESYSELVRKFVKDDRRAVLDSALATRNIEEYHYILNHVIRLADAIGNTELVEIAKNQDRAAVSGNLTKVNEGHEAFINKYTEVLKRLEYVVMAGI